MKPVIVPTVVPQSLENVAAARKRYAFAPSLHIDIVDGLFAPNVTWSVQPGEKLPDAAGMEYEVHLMVQQPLQAGVSFVRAGARRIIGHVEAFDHAEQASEAFNMWRTAGAQQTGIALLLSSPLDELHMYLQLVDFVHVMTIAEVGKQGFAFDSRSIERVAMIHARYPNTTISVDGGETAETVDDLKRAGATRFCVGSALTNAHDPAAEYARLQAAVE